MLDNDTRDPVEIATELSADIEQLQQLSEWIGAHDERQRLLAVLREIGHTDAAGALLVHLYSGKNKSLDNVRLVCNNRPYATKQDKPEELGL